MVLSEKEVSLLSHEDFVLVWKGSLFNDLSYQKETNILIFIINLNAFIFCDFVVSFIFQRSNICYLSFPDSNTGKSCFRHLSSILLLLASECSEIFP